MNHFNFVLSCWLCNFFPALLRYNWQDYINLKCMTMGFPGGSEGKESACNAGDLGLIPGEGNRHSFQYSCLENSMDRGAWGATQYMGSCPLGSCPMGHKELVTKVTTEQLSLTLCRGHLSSGARPWEVSWPGRFGTKAEEGPPLLIGHQLHPTPSTPHDEHYSSAFGTALWKEH